MKRKFVTFLIALILSFSILYPFVGSEVLASTTCESLCNLTKNWYTLPSGSTVADISFNSKNKLILNTLKQNQKNKLFKFNIQKINNNLKKNSLIKLTDGSTENTYSQIILDSSDNIFVLKKTQGDNILLKFSSTGEYISETILLETTGLSVRKMFIDKYNSIYLTYYDSTSKFSKIIVVDESQNVIEYGNIEESMKQSHTLAEIDLNGNIYILYRDPSYANYILKTFSHVADAELTPLETKIFEVDSTFDAYPKMLSVSPYSEIAYATFHNRQNLYEINTVTSEIKYINLPKTSMGKLGVVWVDQILRDESNLIIVLHDQLNPTAYPFFRKFIYIFDNESQSFKEIYRGEKEKQLVAHLDRKGNIIAEEYINHFGTKIQSSLTRITN